MATTQPQTGVAPGQAIRAGSTVAHQRSFLASSPGATSIIEDSSTGNGPCRDRFRLAPPVFGNHADLSNQTLRTDLTVMREHQTHRAVAKAVANT
jgi:hypothetical protein